MFLAIPVRYTYDQKIYWLLAIEIPLLLFILLRAIIESRNEISQARENKENWEKLGDNIKILNGLLETGYFGPLSSSILRNWKEWVDDHPKDIEARQAFIGICTKAARAPEGSDLDPNARIEARAILQELDIPSATPGENVRVPGNQPNQEKCGACGRSLLYLGEETPVEAAMKGEYAAYCRSCGKYVCLPCVAAAAKSQSIIDTTAQVMTGKGQCPCCGAITVNYMK